MRAMAASSNISVVSSIMRLCVCGSVSRVRRAQTKKTGNKTSAPYLHKQDVVDNRAGGCAEGIVLAYDGYGDQHDQHQRRERSARPGPTCGAGPRAP